MPAANPTSAARSRQNKIELTKDYSYLPSGMGSVHDNSRQSAYVSTTASRNNNNNNNSMFNAMRKNFDKYEDFINDTSYPATPAKNMKVAQQPQRPTTPSASKKDFIARNKNMVSSISNKPPVSPINTGKQQQSQRSVVNAQSSVRTVARSATPKPDKKKNAQSTAVPSNDRVPASSVRRPASPPTTTHHASAHHRSHVRADSPDNGLREVNRKLKRRLVEAEELLVEKQREVIELEEIKEILEDENRELKEELERIKRVQSEETKKKDSDNSPLGILSAIMNDHQRIINTHSDATSTPAPLPSLSSLIGTNSSPPAALQKTQTPATTASTTKKDRESNKANNNSIKSVAPVASSAKSHVSSASPKPVAQTSKRMVRPAPFPVSKPVGSSGQRVKGNMVYAKKTAADLNVAMESDGSDADELSSENDTDEDSSDNTTEDETTEDDSESTSTDDGEENDDEDDDDDDDDDDDGENEEMVEHCQLRIPKDTLNPDENSFAPDQNREENDDADSFLKHDLIAIGEEGDDDDDDDEFELDQEMQNQLRQKKSWASFNSVAHASFRNDLSPSTPSTTDHDSPKNNFRRRLRRNNSGSRKEQQSTPNSKSVSDSTSLEQNGSSILNGQSNYSSSYSHMANGNVSTPTNQQSKLHHSNSSDDTPSAPTKDQLNSLHRDSISSDSSNYTTFSRNGSYPSSATSPSGTQTDSDHINNEPLIFSYEQNNSFSHQRHGSSSGHQNDSDYIPARHLPSPVLYPQMVNSHHTSSQPLNTRRTPSPASPPLSPASSTARAQSPASSSRSSTSASESSRFTSGQSRRTRLHESSESSSNRNFVQPPPPPPTTKDPVATLQHFLRLISHECVPGKNSPQEIFDIKKVIDEGSSAKVYTARPVANRKEELAVKIVPLTYSLEFIFNELYVLKNFKHENIVDFKESYLRWDGKNREVWIAMEKCARGDVTSRAGKISEREVSRIARELLQALKHLHSNGVIHRDLKLSNILADANNQIKLADFGISSLEPISTTAMVGTIPYMAPDVVLVSPDRPYDTKVDIWSLGVCILELLSGKAAWGRIRDDEIMDKLRRGEMPSGFQRLADKAEIGWEVKDFLQACFASNADARWSAEKLLEHKFITKYLH